MSTLITRLKQEKMLSLAKKLIENNTVDNIDDAIREAKSLLGIYNTLKRKRVEKPIKEDNYIYTCIDLKDKNVYLLEDSSSLSPLLGYSLQELQVRRIFPIPLISLVEKLKNRDISKHTKEKRKIAFDIGEFVKNIIQNYRLNTITINLDKKNGTFYLYTSQKVDKNVYFQYVCVELDRNKMIEIKSLRKKIKDFIKDFDILLLYFMMLGFSKVYARCTCPMYYQNYNRKKGMANYLCDHLLLTLSLTPYYLIEMLNRI